MLQRVGIAAAAVAVAFTVAISTPVASQTSPATGAATASPHEIPQSVRAERDNQLAQLEWIADHAPQRVAEAARKALEVLRPHFAKDAEQLLPPLALLPALADGRATPDMRWAIAVADRVKAERDQLFAQHVQITSALNDLIAAAEGARDRRLVLMAQRVALHSHHEVEVLLPTVILIGDYLRTKLASGG